MKNSLELAYGIHKAIKKPISKEELLLAITQFSEFNVINKHFEDLNIKYENWN